MNAALSNILLRFKKVVAATAAGWSLGPSTPQQGSGATVANFTLTGCASGSTIVIGVVLFNPTSTIVSVTCVGESNPTAIGALQRAVAGQISDAACQLYVLDHTTSSGNKVFAVTVTAGTFVDAGGIEFAGGLAGSTLDVSNTAQSNTVNLTTTAAGDLIVSVTCCAASNSPTAGNTEFLFSHGAEDDQMYYLTSLNAGAPGVKTADYNSSGNTIIAAAAFKHA